MRMRRMLPVFLVILCFVPELPAKTSSDWKDVEWLEWDTPLRVQLWGGQEYIGRFDFADAKIFRLKIRSNENPGQTATSITFDRQQVQVVEKLSKRDPNLETYRKAGIAAGGVAGATALGLAVKHSAWPAGVIFGGLGGAGAGMIVGDTVGLIAHASSRHRTIVYQSREHPPVPHPPNAN